MATSLQEALAGQVSVKPVTMEQIPDATIDVSGGSSALDIEGLGVKKRRNDISSITSSTSQMGMQDFFGDLLDEVNFTDSNSVDAFKASAASRITEMDYGSISNFLGDASSMVGELSSAASQFEKKQQPQSNGFQTLFGDPVSGSDGGFSDDYTNASDFENPTNSGSVGTSDLTNPNMASNLVGSAISVLGGAPWQSVAMGLGRGALSTALGPEGRAVQKTVNIAGTIANTSITNVSSALGAVNTGLNAAQTAISVQDALNRGISLEGIFKNSINSLGEYLEGIWSAVTNPAQALEAFGMNMHYGTQDPDLYSFNLPGGAVNFNFDGKTGKLATPGFLGFMFGSVPLVGAAFRASQAFADLSGYREDMSTRAMSMIDSFSMPGINYAELTDAENNNFAGISGFSNSLGGDNAVSIDFSSVAGNVATYGNQQIDFTSLDPAGKISSLSLREIEEASVINMHWDWEDELEAQTAVRNSFSAIAERFGIDPNSPGSIGQVNDAMQTDQAARAVDFMGEMTNMAKASNIDFPVSDFGDRAGLMADSFGRFAQDNPALNYAAQNKAASSITLGYDPNLTDAARIERYSIVQDENRQARDLEIGEHIAGFNPGSWNSSNSSIISRNVAFEFFEKNPDRSVLKPEDAAALAAIYREQQKEETRSASSDVEMDYGDVDPETNIEDDPTESGEGANTSAPGMAFDSTADETDGSWDSPDDGYGGFGDGHW